MLCPGGVEAFLGDTRHHPEGYLVKFYVNALSIVLFFHRKYPFRACLFVEFVGLLFANSR